MPVRPVAVAAVPPVKPASPVRRAPRIGCLAGWIAVAAAAGGLAWPTAARAGCWFDPALTQQARQIAQSLMPELQKVPDVWVCSPEHFPPRVEGLREVLPSLPATPPT